MPNGGHTQCFIYISFRLFYCTRGKRRDKSVLGNRKRGKLRFCEPSFPVYFPHIDDFRGHVDWSQVQSIVAGLYVAGANSQERVIFNPDLTSHLCALTRFPIFGIFRYYGGFCHHLPVGVVNKVPIFGLVSTHQAFSLCVLHSEPHRPPGAHHTRIDSDEEIDREGVVALSRLHGHDGGVVVRGEQGDNLFP